jgi:hypothetical protein
LEGNGRKDKEMVKRKKGTGDGRGMVVGEGLQEEGM